jgi:hypothetical protein
MRNMIFTITKINHMGYICRKVARQVMLMADREATMGEKKRGNVKIDLPESLNDPKFERSDKEFMTDEFRREIER